MSDISDYIIQLSNAQRHFYVGGTTVKALAGVDLDIERGSYVAIMGPSGSGKSTMLNILGCLDRLSLGSYSLGGEDVAKVSDDSLSKMRGKSIGFIFQSYNLISQLNVLENIQVPLIYQYLDLKKYEDHCKELADIVGLGSRLDHRPSQLSGGQQQRVAIARALVNDPLMILADEPIGNLDSKTGVEILNLIDDLNSKGKTIVMVTHDPQSAERAKRVIHMLDGKIEEEVING